MINKTLYQGRLTRDIELKKTSSDIAYAEFSVAWSEKYKESETKCFLRCKAWRSTAEFLQKYFSKGSMMIVEGSLQSRKWQDKNGNNRVNWEVIADRVHFVDSRKQEAKEPVFEEVNDEEELPF